MKLRVATVWLGGCSGCHMSFLDLDEFLIELAGKVELVYSPVMDVKEYPEERGCLPHRRRRLQRGQPRNPPQNPRADESARLLRRLRRHRQRPGHAQPTGPGNAENVLQRAYIENAQNNPCVPKADGIVPALLERVTPVHEDRLCRILPARLPAAGRRASRALIVAGAGRPDAKTGRRTNLEIR